MRKRLAPALYLLSAAIWVCNSWLQFSSADIYRRSAETYERINPTALAAGLPGWTQQAKSCRAMQDLSNSLGWMNAGISVMFLCVSVSFIPTRKPSHENSTAG